MTSLLTSWPILNFIPEEISSVIKEAIVFGKDGNEAIVILKNDDVYAVGNNAYGCLGVSNEDRATLEPKKIKVLCQKRVVSIACGIGPHVLALTKEGEVYTWGNKRYDQLGNDACDNDIPVKIHLKDSLEFEAVACGEYHSVVLSVGNVFTWGCNLCGQLGLNKSNHDIPYPRCVMGPLTNGKKNIVTSVACGKAFTLALTEDGELYSWGYNGDGQLGIGNYDNQFSPVKVDSLDGQLAAKVVCGMSHVLVLTRDGELYSCGDNKYGQLGVEDILSNVSSPTRMSEVNERWTDIIAYHYNDMSVGMTESGRVFMWGKCKGLKVHTPREIFTNDMESVFAKFASSPSMTKLTKIKSNQDQHLLAFESAFNDVATSDFIFLAHGKSIHVHKAILKIKCEYFRNMFSSHWKEANIDEIIVDKFSYNVYESFLKYLYTGRVDISPCDAIDLLHLADSYCESRLMLLCENIVKRGITVENVARLLASKYNVGELGEFCFRFAVENLTAVTQTKAFQEADGECIKNFMIKASMNDAFKR